LHPAAQATHDDVVLTRTYPELHDVGIPVVKATAAVQVVGTKVLVAHEAAPVTVHVL